MSSLGNKPWPIPVSNIPGGYCYEPTDLSASVTDDIVTLSWTSPHDNDGFYINHWQDGQAAVQTLVFGRSIQLQLSSHTLYNWSVRTMCDRIAPRGSSTVLGVPFTTGNESVTCPVIDISNALIIKAGSSVRLEWTATPNIINYRLEFKDRNTGGRIDLTSYTNSVTLKILNPHTEYQWRVQAVCDVDKAVPFSEWASFTTGIGADCPGVEVKAIASATSMIVYWKYLATARTYQVYLNGTLMDATHPVNIVTLQNLNPLTAYTVIIIPNCEEGEGEMTVFTAQTIDHLLQDPANLTGAVSQDNDIIISWTPAENISYQEISVNGSMQVLGPLVSSFLIPKPPANTRYSVVVRSVKDDFKSIGAYVIVTMPPYCTAVPEANVTIAGHTFIQLTWKSITGANQYRVRHRMKTSINWISSATDSTTYTFRNLVPDTEYVFEITTECPGRMSSPLLVEAVTSVTPACPFPINVTVGVISPTTASIAFGLSDGTVPYEGKFQLSFDDGVNPPILSGATQSPHTVTGLLPATLYLVTVLNQCGDVPSYSEPVSVLTTKECELPASARASLQGINNDELLVEWDAFTDPDTLGVNVKYRQLGSLDWIDNGDVTGMFILPVLSVVIPGVVSSLYEIKLTTLYADYRKCDVAAISSIPKILNLKHGQLKPTMGISWDVVQGVDHYLVNISSLTDSWTLISFTPSMYLFLEKDTTYTVNVVAEYNGATGAVSDDLVFNTGSVVDAESPCDPPLVEAFKQDSNFNNENIAVGTKLDVLVTLLDYNRDIGYEVKLIVAGEAVPTRMEVVEPQRFEFDGTVIFEQVDVNEMTVTVETFNINGKICQTNIPVNDTTCSVPTSLASSNITDNSFDLTWDDMPGTLQYEVYLDDTLIDTVTGISYTVTGLNYSTTYKINVRSKCGTYIYSPFTVDVNVTTMPAP